MTGLAQVLEDFGTFSASEGARVELSDVALEEQRLQSFEQGYTAGWDDAIKAQSDDKTRVSADLAQNLQDLSFTYRDAINRMSRALKPLLTQVVNKILPKLAHDTLGAQVVEQLTEMVGTQTELPIEIVVSPENSAALRVLLEQETSMPVAIIDEPSLGAGQVYIRFGTVEREINLDIVLGGISEAVDAFFHQVEQEMTHG
jgi:flagellar biosynthesis/type III secretory pathway protein FliH